MQVVSACLARDLPVYRHTFRSLRENLPAAELNVITRKQDFQKFREACGSKLILWDETDFVRGMTLAELRKLPLSFFPVGAGWYYQQFLKYSFVDVSNDDEYFLIWDADTVLLRPLEFFDANGMPFYTKAAEHHLPYFETFRSLFGTEAQREFSFISQHQVIEKKLLREMLAEIENRNPSSRNWAWAIMDNLRGAGTNLFSEYETYGHYARRHRPNTLSFRELPWLRDGSRTAGYPPSGRAIERLAKRYYFAAFEANGTRMRRLARWIRKFF